MTKRAELDKDLELALVRKQEARTKPHLMGFGSNGRSETKRTRTEEEVGRMIDQLGDRIIASAG